MRDAFIQVAGVLLVLIATGAALKCIYLLYILGTRRRQR